MPYYRCTICSLVSYSAANYSTVGTCAHCDSPLADAEVVSEPARLGSRYTRRTPTTALAAPRGSV
jgi:hypothetical protein